MSDRMERSRAATIHVSSNYHLAHESFAKKKTAACKQFNVESILETMETMFVCLDIACRLTKPLLRTAIFLFAYSFVCSEILLTTSFRTPTLKILMHRFQRSRTIKWSIYSSIELNASLIVRSCKSKAKACGHKSQKFVINRTNRNDSHHRMETMPMHCLWIKYSDFVFDATSNWTIDQQLLHLSITNIAYWAICESMMMKYENLNSASSRCQNRRTKMEGATRRGRRRKKTLLSTREKEMLSMQSNLLPKINSQRKDDIRQIQWNLAWELERTTLFISESDQIGFLLTSRVFCLALYLFCCLRPR